MDSTSGLAEFQIILDLSSEDTQKKLDKALKRNLETQQTTKPEIINQEVVKEVPQTVE